MTNRTKDLLAIGAGALAVAAACADLATWGGGAATGAAPPTVEAPADRDAGPARTGVLTSDR